MPDNPEAPEAKGAQPPPEKPKLPPELERIASDAERAAEASKTPYFGSAFS